MYVYIYIYAYIYMHVYICIYVHTYKYRNIMCMSHSCFKKPNHQDRHTNVFRWVCPKKIRVDLEKIKTNLHN